MDSAHFCIDGNGKACFFCLGNILLLSGNFARVCSQSSGVEEKTHTHCYENS